MKKPLADQKTHVGGAAYEAVTEVFRRNKQGLTVADLAAKTGLPLETVREAAPRAADEFGAKLSVTESGEILYSFPAGFSSRYRGAGVFFKKVLRAAWRGIAVFASWAFKVWIMLMLVGYFAFFMLLALAALVLSTAASSSNSSSSRRSGSAFNLVGGMFNMIMRLWFYSELFKLDRSYYRGGRAPAKPKGRPLHKAVFSFVFGDGDPNADIEERYRRALIAFVQANGGVINLEEYIAITGKPPIEADRDITAFCVECGGVPEAAEDGTIIYRFDALMLKNITNAPFVPFKEPRSFSANPASMNRWFSVINTVNLLFGGYFLYNAVTATEVTGFTYFYALTHMLGSQIFDNPRAVIFTALGIIPAAFSIFFWLIPLVRNFRLKKENASIKKENQRKIIMKEVYDKPLAIEGEKLSGGKNNNAADFIKEMSFFGSPEITKDDKGQFVYSFADIERDKKSTEKYRRSITRSPNKTDIGKVIFET